MKRTTLIIIASIWSIIYIIAATNVLYRIDEIASFNNSEDLEEGNNYCPPGHVRLGNDNDAFISSSSSQIDLGYIPPVVHVIVESKCVKPNVHSRIIEKWKSKYKLLFHDRDEVDELLLKKRQMFQNMNEVVKCIHKIEYEIDLIKLLLLWDYGGIVCDLQFLLKHTSDNFFDIHLDHNDEAFFMKNATDASFHTTAMGSVQSHPIIYMMIQKFISNLFQQYDDERIFKTDHGYRRNNMLKIPLDLFFRESLDGDETSMKRRYFGIYNRTVTIFNVTQSDSHDVDYESLVSDGIVLQQKKDVLPCVTFDHDDDTKSDLQEIIGSLNNNKCNEPLILFEDRIHHGRQDRSQRKIPKIVHLTSKTRCLTDNYTDNTHTWFFEDHSVVLHDDDAVSRLMQRKLKEFPHLQDASKCITSGAGMADVWRYLVLWVYGGIYTDIDNAPGPRLFNGTAIHDDMDAFLEVEVGSFPVSNCF